MKTAIKIILIAVVLAAIAAAILFFTKGVDTSEGEKPIATTAFEKQVERRTAAEVAGKTYEEARSGFESILGDIRTESAITLADGSRNLSEAEEDKAKRILFYEYAPIFAQYAEGYFQKASWDDEPLKALRTEALELAAMNIAEKQTPIAQTLASTAQNVDDYYAAWQVARSASGCTSVAGIKSIAASAQKYLKAPLTNNTALASALRGAESEAKRAAARNIAAQCNRVANGYAGHGNYSAWVSAYNGAMEKIRQYTSAYGTNSELSAAQSALNRADNNALNYYEY